MPSSAAAGKDGLFAVALHMINFHSRIELSGTDTHECNPVSVCFVHIRLDLKYKRGKILAHRINHAASPLFAEAVRMSSPENVSGKFPHRSS